MRVAEMEITKGQNLIEHRDEIMSRPARTWFQTEREKKLAQGALLSCSKVRLQSTR